MKKIGVLFGGRSSEHEVSRVSAYSIIKNIDKEKYIVLPIGITKDGKWLPFTGSVEAIPNGEWEKIALEGTQEEYPLQKALPVLADCDCILPVLHGQNGEDGTVQGLFELLDKPYVGCGVFSSAACMDKIYTKTILSALGIPQCKWTQVIRHELKSDLVECIRRIESRIGYPCFVKPANGGSSVGISKVRDREELVNALEKAGEYDRRIIVEEAVEGREIECSVLGNSQAIAACPGEIKPSRDFYDYDDKYSCGTSVSEIPADILPQKAEQIKEMALKAYSFLDCSGLARVDFFLKENGEVLLNEINTLPGFTQISMYSKMWIAEGKSYTQLLSDLIELAFLRKDENRRSFNG